MNLDKDEKDYLYHKKDLPFSKDELLKVYREERNRGCPHHYIVGKICFFDLLLEVNGSCLIPRLETELLVERCLDRIPASGKVLDLCSGSGAIGLAIKKANPNLEVTLLDISNPAMNLAKKNAEHNNLDVECIVGDLFLPLKGRVFDVIISNPPYITEKDYLSLDRSVREFEPKIALVGGDDGLAVYKQIREEAFQYLNKGGLLCLEIGKDQGVSVPQLFSDEKWRYKKVEKDYSAHDRFFFLKREPEVL